MALKQLGTEHLLAIKYLAMPKNGGLTHQQIAKECGVHANSITNWKKDPLFERELKREIVRNTHDKLPELMDSMLEHAIKDGNAAMAKLVLTANDMLTDKVEVTQTQGNDKGIDAIKARLARYRDDHN